MAFSMFPRGYGLTFSTCPGPGGLRGRLGDALEVEVGESIRGALEECLEEPLEAQGGLNWAAIPWMKHGFILAGDSLTSP